MSSTLTVLSCNFENNGGGKPEKRLAMNERMRALSPDLVFRQEVWDSDANGSTIGYETEDFLGLRGWLGPRSCTSVLANPDVFTPVREWPQTGPMWVLPPTALTARFAPAGAAALPLVLVSYHLNYGSTTLRQSEAEWLTTWNDRQWTTSDDQRVRLPALMGGDNNSYPEPGVVGDPPLPKLTGIRDQPHRVHRSFVGPAGTRVMDTRPDEILRSAGMEDVARHFASGPKGTRAAVAATVDQCETHGPDARIDRIYASATLLDAVVDVDVIDMQGLSDHHTVRLRLDPVVLAELLNQRLAA
ncbi:endonuclease/exonuclease/phosphatase family protein [Streptomyces sp. RKAG337]|uniref:endonuclease/exonuclease/phosphatase family protein n=1 Tax=Streptomyces sp. RKAG337 TaxID=2893404 RepID=UPI002033A41D|nr:endonuclease/exonuclease/phosphatase family protein [Streptomyces sp. RKAG337]MCM2431030.1 endonuclease/exonuclease/phosphatase family protein [Streptomyces sp. RKAG337]